MINKVSKRINELIQSQSQQPLKPQHQHQSQLHTPTNKSKNSAEKIMMSSTPPRSKKSDRLNITDNNFINHSTTQLKNRPSIQIIEMEEQLNRTRSIHSEQKIYKEMGALIEHYKAEIMSMIQPLIYEIEDKLVSRILKLQKVMREISEENLCLKSDLLEKQFTLDPGYNKIQRIQRQVSSQQQEEIKFKIADLVVKAETIQLALEKNSVFISQRLDNLELKYQNLSKQNSGGNKVVGVGRCNCQGFIEKILSTETSLAQQIKFIKHQIDKIKGK